MYIYKSVPHVDKQIGKSRAFLLALLHLSVFVFSFIGLDSEGLFSRVARTSTPNKHNLYVGCLFVGLNVVKHSLDDAKLWERTVLCGELWLRGLWFYRGQSRLSLMARDLFILEINFRCAKYSYSNYLADWFGF